MRWEGRALCLVGPFAGAQVTCAEKGAEAAGVSMTSLPECGRVPAQLADSKDTIAVLVSMNAAGADAMFAHIRGQASLSGLALIGVYEAVGDLEFTELFLWGGDDLLSLESPHRLARRLRALALLPRNGAPPATPTRSAIVAGADPKWRSVMGRSLHQGGFLVHFASTPDDLGAARLLEAAVVVLADDPATGDAKAILPKARGLGCRAAWVVVAPPKRLAAVRAAAERLGPVAVADGFAPPENVLFLANDLVSPRGVDQRASRRVLFGTAVTFRAAGSEQDDVGFTYNVSAAGLYVRSLVPLAQGLQVWIELWAPRCDRRVRLTAVVAWQRPFGSSAGATAPPGFGLQIVGGLTGDVDRWRSGYAAFAEDMLGLEAQSSALASLED